MADWTRPQLDSPGPGTLLNRALNDASAKLSLPHFKPHGSGRAYYVKVRRSQGADDSTISGELGQTTNGELIRSVYGDPQDLLGGQLFDWLPDGHAPAWNLLAANSDTTLLPPNAGMIWQDTVRYATQETAKPLPANQLAHAETPISTA